MTLRSNSSWIRSGRPRSRCSRMTSSNSSRPRWAWSNTWVRLTSICRIDSAYPKPAAAWGARGGAGGGGGGGGGGVRWRGGRGGGGGGWGGGLGGWGVVWGGGR